MYIYAGCLQLCIPYVLDLKISRIVSTSSYLGGGCIFASSLNISFELT